MRKNENGFSAVEGLLILFIVGIIGFVGWYVWNSKKNADKSLSQANTSTNASTSTEQLSSTQQKEADLYTGWKRYCDDKAALCFKYPSDWKIEDESRDQARDSIYVSVISPKTTARVAYQSRFEKDGGVRNVTPIKLVNSSTFKGFSVAGTYSIYLDKHTVVYDLIKGSVEHNGFKVGQITKELDNPRFDYNGVTYKVFGTPLKNASITQDFANENEAKAWFDSSEGKTVELILLSFGTK